MLESGFPLQHASGRVMAPRGARCVYSINTSSKQQITMLACINGAGQWISPMHVFPGERFRFNPLEGGVQGAYIGRSQSGWMNCSMDDCPATLSCHFVSAASFSCKYVS